MHKQVSTQVLAVLAGVLLLSSPHLATGEDAVLKLDLKLDGEIRSLRFTPRDDLVQAAERFEHEQLRGVQGGGQLQMAKWSRYCFTSLGVFD